jgi:predicted TPR repeat methyltransferase
MPESEHYDKDYFYGGKGYSHYGVADATFYLDFLKKHDDCHRVLEIGCATGTAVQKLRDEGYDAWGIDISEFAVSSACEETKPYLKCADPCVIGTLGEFDAIVSNDTFEHIEEGKLMKLRDKMQRAANHFFFRVGTEETPNMAHDTSHITVHPLQWWKDWMPEAEIIISK